MLLPLSVAAYWAGSTQPVSGTVTYEIVIEEPSIKELVQTAAIKYDVPFNELWYTIGCETQDTFDPTIQSNVKYDFSDSRRGIVYGEREQSYGLAQIHLPDHPEVSYKQATDAKFSIEFIASNWKKHSGWWYTWKYKSCGPIIK